MQFLQPILPDISDLSNQELLTLREQINKSLNDLTDINLEAELVAMYKDTKELLSEVDEESTPNQTASLINACQNILKELAKTQSEIHNAERIKVMEATLIEVLSKESPQLAEEFIVAYEVMLEENLGT